MVGITDKKVFQLNRNLEIVNRLNTGNGPDGIGISKDDQSLYVTNTEDGTISIINTQTKKSTLIKKGGKPELIHSNSDNSLLLISNFFNNEGYILNTRQDSITHTITGLDGPDDIIMAHNGERVFAVNFNVSKVYVFNTSDYSKRTREYVVGNKPIGFAQLNKQKAYVSNYGDNTVSIVTLNIE